MRQTNRPPKISKDWNPSLPNSSNDWKLAKRAVWVVGMRGFFADGFAV
jgi:hypothetical protein